MRLIGRAALIAAAALYLAGCGGGDDDTKATAPQAAKADDAQPATTLLSRKEVDEQPSGSAARTVMNLLYWAQWGNWPEIVASYEPRIRSVAKDSQIVGTYQQQRGTLMTTRFSIRDQASTSRGQFVAVEFTPSDGAKQSQSYLLVRRGGRWRISNDTFFEGAYRTYIQDLVQSQVAPNATKPSRQAVNAASAAAESLRAAVVAPVRGRP